MKLLLIDSRVDYQPIIDNKKEDVDYLIFNYMSDTFSFLLNKIEDNKYEQIGLVQHANFSSGFDILNNEERGLNTDIEPYVTFNSIKNFLNNLKLKGINIFDFLGCELFDPIITPAIFSYLENSTGINLRASTNLTGSNGGDWILESDNINIKNTYFTDGIDSWNGLLYAYSVPSFQSWNKDISGNVIYLYKDISGYPLNPLYDTSRNNLVYPSSSIVTWGNIGTTPPSSLSNNVVSVVSTHSGFAALKENGSVVSWGSNADTSLVASDLSSGVVALFTNFGAFAALKNNGSVVTWGSIYHGGNSSSVSLQLSSGVTDIYSTAGAFAAIKNNGSVVTWGDSNYGGDSSSVANQLLSGVVSIYSTNRAFAALKSDGSVVTWGNPIYGANSSAVAAQLTSGVISIQGSESTFAALKSDGSVVNWGNETTTSSQLSSDIVAVYPSIYSFAALKSNGSVFMWGNVFRGGAFIVTNPDFSTSSPIGNVSSGVVTIAATNNAFAALKNDGSVVTWGIGNEGGDSSAVSSQLSSGVVAIYANAVAFAALKNDGSVVTWGSAANGGNSSGVAASLSSNVVSIYATDLAFAALKSNGSVVTWGADGGNSSSVSGQITSGGAMIFSNGGSFALLKPATSVTLSDYYYPSGGSKIVFKPEVEPEPEIISYNYNSYVYSGPVSWKGAKWNRQVSWKRYRSWWRRWSKV